MCANMSMPRMGADSARLQLVDQACCRAFARGTRNQYYVLLPGLSVYRLPDEIRVTVVPRVLLDHVAQDPAQARRGSIRPGPLGQLIQSASRERLGHAGARSHYCLLPERTQLV